MIKHRGKIVKAVLRKNGHQLGVVAEKLSMSRHALYKRFANPVLEYDFILKMGQVINFNFASIFPGVNRVAVKTTLVGLDGEFIHLHRRYSQLLESYKRLLDMLMFMSSLSQSEEAKVAIEQFVRTHSIL